MDPHGGDQRPELPRPTLWPVGFAVGIACILVGLVISWPAVAVGGGIALVFGFLWARDVMAGRARAAAAPETVDVERPLGPPLPAQAAGLDTDAPPGDRTGAWRRTTPTQDLVGKVRPARLGLRRFG